MFIAKLKLLLVVFVATASLQAQLSRVANTTLAFPQNPQSFGYRTVEAFAGITFSQPIGFASIPNETERVFVFEKAGRIHAVSNLGTAPVKSLYFDLSARVLITNPSSEEGLLGLAFHPQFATNRYFYVFYTTTATTTAGTGRHDRVSRFTATLGASNSDILATEVSLISQYDEATNHNAGDIHFGPDGYLYVALGDEGGGNDRYENGQRIDRDFFAGLLRIDVDRRSGNLTPNAHPSVHAGTYLVPSDNPFIGLTSFNGVSVSPASVRTEFWATGLRNPWRFSFDVPSGRLYLGDVGQSQREEINVITRGGNYGWSYREGSLAGPKANPPGGVTFTDPVFELTRDQATSVTGGVVYRGNRYAQLFGRYVFGDYPSGRIWAMTVPPSGPAQVEPLLTTSYPAAFGIDPLNGDVLIAHIVTGAISRLVYDSTSTGTPLPSTLSATGAFSSLSTLTPAAGIVAYEPNVSFWSDHALKRRWFSVPNLADKITFAAEGNWTFPAGTVWVKHFDLELTRGNPSTARRLETRFLVKTASSVYGVTYRWNSAQTEATLVPEEGQEENFTINESGVTRLQKWRYPSRADCLQCHTPVAGHALSFNTPQLNRTNTYGSTTANVLTALANAGYFTTPTVPAPSTLRALAAADDTSASLEHRARSYLAANCISCHQPGGPALGNWDARIETSLANTGLINGSLINNGGDNLNRVIAPRDTAHSMLLKRINVRGATQMPPLASSELDQAGISLLTSWINSLGTPVIATQPSSLTVVQGSSATFSVSLNGQPTATYQWFKDGQAIQGATSASFVIGSAQLSDGGNYTVSATNSFGSVSSSAAPLAVTLPLPTPVVTAGRTLTLAAGQGGSYRWQSSTDGVNWANLTDNATYSGTSSATLTLTDVPASLNGLRLRYVLTNGAITTSAQITITVNSALFPSPVCIVIDASGTLYVGDAQTCTIQRVSSTGIVRLLAGANGQPGTSDGAGAAARFNQPSGLALSGDLLSVSDTANNTLRRVSVSNGIVTTLAGSAVNRGHQDGTGSAAWFSSPLGLALSPSGSLIVADSLNQTLRQVSSSAVVTTLAGSPGMPGTTNGIGSAARFRTPSAIVRDSVGNFFIADTGNNVIRKITSPDTVTTFVGLEGVVGSSDGMGAAALFNQPAGLAIDSANNLYVADTANSTIRRITPSGAVTTIAGLPGVSGLRDGAGATAWFSQPRALTVDATNNIYVADTGNSAIRRITANGAVSTLSLMTESSLPPTSPPVGGNPQPPSSGAGNSGGGGAPSLSFVFVIVALFCLRKMRC